MKIPGLSWFAEKLRERIRTLLWGIVASDVETESILHHADNLDRLEDRARQLEAEGKTEQAAALRRRAAMINPESPAGLALTAMADVGEDRQRTVTAVEQEPAKLPAPKRSRSRTRRPSRRKKPAESKTDTNDVSDVDPTNDDPKKA